MRTWVGHRIDDGTTAVFAFEQPRRPSLDEVREPPQLRQLSDDPVSNPDRENEVLTQRRDFIERIEASEGPVGLVVPVHPPSTERRFDWGQDSPGAGDLARSLLTDAVGDPPPDHVVQQYLAEVIASLPKECFRLDATDIHDWLVAKGLFVEAELVAHRGGLDPEGFALRVIAPDEATGNPPDGLVTDPATASALVAACEQAWADIQRRHPDVPHAVVVLGSGVERGRLVKLGHWWGGRWLADGEVRGEVLLAGEALHLPAEKVFKVLLHEAAHGLNAARGIKDASRGGRYHNRRFQATAELVGLDVAAMPPYGWARTTLTADTIERYREAIDRLGDAMRIARTVERPASLGTQEAEAGDAGPSGREESSTEESEPRRAGAAMCGCGRRMRMAPSILAAGPVLCGLCGKEFQPGRQASRVTQHELATEPERASVVDRTFLSRRRRLLATERGEPLVLDRPQVRLSAFISAARDAGFGAHPAVVALAHQHNLLAGVGNSDAAEPPDADLIAVQREGLTELVLAGDKPGDWAVASWYQALGTEHEQPMPAGDLGEVGRRHSLARAMLKADGTLYGPAAEVLGREFLAGERIVVGPTGIRSLDLDAGIPGTVEHVDPSGQWLYVDFPTAGHYRFAVNGPEAAALTYGYAEVIQGLNRVDLRVLDLHPGLEAQPLPPVQLPEIDF